MEWGVWWLALNMMNGKQFNWSGFQTLKCIKFSIIHIQNNNEETLFGLDEAYAT